MKIPKLIKKFIPLVLVAMLFTLLPMIHFLKAQTVTVTEPSVEYDSATPAYGEGIFNA